MASSSATPTCATRWIARAGRARQYADGNAVRGPTMDGMTVLPACAGVALRLRRGQRLQIVNTHGTQVVDCWALNLDDLSEHMSMPHSRNHWYRLVPRPGDVLVTNLRN